MNDFLILDLQPGFEISFSRNNVNITLNMFCMRMSAKIRIKTDRTSLLASIRKINGEVRELRRVMKARKRGSVRGPDLAGTNEMTDAELSSLIRDRKSALLDLKRQRKIANRRDYAARNERMIKLRNTYLNAGFNFGAFDDDEKEER